MTYTWALHGTPVASYEIGADIDQFKYVKLSTTSNLVVIAGAGERGIGITQAAVDYTGWENTVAVKEYWFSFAKAGTGWRTRWDFLKVDANGDLVVTTTDTDIVVSQARDTVSATEIWEIKIIEPVLYSALA